ncbi:MAG: phosphonate metabolism protein PhnM [Syntrophomonadaceae bacterium]|nr:phosphonate metabolism protein PhnM [Syntrophomonadaceae bacterium]
MYVITNGQIITENSIITGYDLVIQNDLIAEIAPQGKYRNYSNIRLIDAGNGFVAPGFIDIHSDYIEFMAAPRPTSVMDFQMAIRETEKQLAAHGITTIFHSLSLFKTSELGQKPIRDPENVQKLMDSIAETRQGQYLIRHNFHVRFEIDNLEEIANLKAYIQGRKVQLLSFMDHSPGQGQYRDLEAYRQIIKGYRSLADEEFADIIYKHQHKAKATIEELREIAALAKANRIAIASHDDDTPEKVDLVHSLGATISEFPITLEVAKKAKEKGMYTLAGAPNVILGGSHNGNMSAAEAIMQNSLDILCSDYYPPSLLHAIFAMQHKRGQDLVEMMKLVTINPARAVRMDRHYGSLAPGKKADVLIIENIDGYFPIITSVFVDGKLVQNTYYRL